MFNKFILFTMSLLGICSALRPLLSKPRIRFVRELSMHNRPDFTKEANDNKYFPQSLEKDLYKWWEDEGYFKPNIDSKRKPFVIPMPPPNVTGYLHMGFVITAPLYL